MQLPNKLYSYKNSTLALVPIVLKKLKDGPLPVCELYERVKSLLPEAKTFCRLWIVCMLCMQWTSMMQMRCFNAY